MFKDEVQSLSHYKGPKGQRSTLRGGGPTVTSLPRLTSASTFLMPCPLPTCQMMASTGWLVIGQSRACSSYQMVLSVVGGGTNLNKTSTIYPSCRVHLDT